MITILKYDAGAKVCMLKESAVRSMNPWWKSASNISSDEQILQWRASGLRRDPDLRRSIKYDYEPSNTVVYILHGPQRAGKTTLVKMQIREFLERGADPLDIFYHLFDASNTIQDVVDVVCQYLKIRGRRGGSRACLFLDEASAIKGWQRGVKWLVDADMLRNCTVTVTGSHAFHVKHASERMPGRWGEAEGGRDKMLRPAGFLEYASLMDPAIADLVRDNGLSEFGSRRVLLDKMASGEIDERADLLHRYQNELDALLDSYMQTGGTPEAMEEYARTRRVGDDLYRLCRDGAAGQCADLHRDGAVLRRFCAAAADTLGRRSSWRGLSRQSGMGSPGTARAYADVLECLFILAPVLLYDPVEKRPILRSGPKLHFCDPLFLHAFRGPDKDIFEAGVEYLESEDGRQKALSGIVADHLIRRAFESGRYVYAFDHLYHVFYWRDPKGREVDFVFHDGDSQVPIQVKCRNGADPRDLAPLASFLDASGASKGLVVSKTELAAKRDYVSVPASVFLAML